MRMICVEIMKVNENLLREARGSLHPYYAADSVGTILLSMLCWDIDMTVGSTVQNHAWLIVRTNGI